MKLIISSLVLWCLVIGEELAKHDNIHKIAGVLSKLTNDPDSNESLLTLFSYVDRMECGVEKSWKGNIFTESCNNLRKMGVNETGFYLLSNKGIAFCDMSKNWNDSDIQTIVGKIRFKDVK